MKRTNAIIAVVAVIIVIVAAAGAVLLMNPGSNPSTSEQGGGATDIRPSGPEGSVNSAVITTGGTNESNASSLPELREEFNATPGNNGRPDALVKVAVTNNRTDTITLKCHNFTAKLENGSSTRALNNNTETIAPNATAFICLGFVTHGVNITALTYDDGNISFTASWRRTTVPTLPMPVIRNAPNGTLTGFDNLSFSSLNTWVITKGGHSPMSLQFDNRSMVLAMMTVTNNNTTAVNLKASDFWIDLGNGSWAQGEDRINNNVPAMVRPNTTVPFLLGFRGTTNATPTAIYYWPGAGNQGEKIPIQVNSEDVRGPFGVLKKLWDGNATSRSNGTNATSTRTVMVQMLLVGEGANDTGLSSVTAWTLKNGTLAPTSVQENNSGLNVSKGRVVTLTFTVGRGDDLTLLSFQDGGGTKYVWLRPLQSAA